MKIVVDTSVWSLALRRRPRDLGPRERALTDHLVDLIRDDRVVMLVTGDGLKTPDPIAERLTPVEIDADADALLDSLGVL